VAVSRLSPGTVWRTAQGESFEWLCPGRDWGSFDCTTLLDQLRRNTRGSATYIWNRERPRTLTGDNYIRSQSACQFRGSRFILTNRSKSGLRLWGRIEANLISARVVTLVVSLLPLVVAVRLKHTDHHTKDAVTRYPVVCSLSLTSAVVMRTTRHYTSRIILNVYYMHRNWTQVFSLAINRQFWQNYLILISGLIRSRRNM
jgi:hypothetical protein